MAFTSEQMAKILRYLTRKLQEDNIDINSGAEVIMWMLNNPLPSKEEYQAQIAAWDEEDKAERIAGLQAQLDELQGE